MALEVVTDSKNDKTDKNDWEQHENTGRDMCFVLCAAFFFINK